MTDRHLVTFYFDPISPYAWLASKQLDRIEAAGAEVRLQPVLFAAMLNAHGQKGPAEIAAKRVYTFRDVMREAARQQLRFRGPPGHPFNPLQALRLCRAIESQPQRRQFALAVFAACWEDGEDMASMPALLAVAQRCGLDGEALAAAAATPALKRALADDTAQAIADGIFGVPTFRFNGELFWGADRVDALLACLAGQTIDEANLQRFLALPPSAVRVPM
jgi:2-hydroxychromene-2-carboxylate isomerase